MDNLRFKNLREEKKNLSKKHTEKNIKGYRNYKNVLNSCLKNAENSYYLEKISDKKNGITNFWKSFGKTINKK